MLKKTDELKNRIEAKKHELQARLAELKADTKKDAASARDGIKQRLDELEDALRDGWENISDSVVGKLNSWLDRKN